MAEEKTENKKAVKKTAKKPVANKGKVVKADIVLSSPKLKFENVIKYPLATESAIRLIDDANKLVFIVDRNAKKPDVKVVLEALYGIKVTKVRTMITSKGKKKAYVSLAEDSPAIDLATKLGIM